MIPTAYNFVFCHLKETGLFSDNQQVPTYNTGNCTQYSVITYMVKESEKEWMPVCASMLSCV